VKRDAVVACTSPIVEHDFVERLLASQHGRQQDAVVVRVRLGAEHGDVVEIGARSSAALQRAHTRHAVADHHQFHFFFVVDAHVHGLVLRLSFSTCAWRV
jgi:molybdopterin-guanine dinucleotide biosynthesis protein A